MNKSNIRVICDAGPVIHLDELNCLELLCDFQEIILADTVREEVKHHRPEALKKPDIHFMRASQECPEGALLRTMCRVFSLDAGETDEALNCVAFHTSYRNRPNHVLKASENFYTNP